MLLMPIRAQGREEEEGVRVNYCSQPMVGGEINVSYVLNPGPWAGVGPLPLTFPFHCWA